MARDIMVDGDSACIFLTKGFVTWVDVSVLDRVAKYNWCVTKCDKHHYAVRSLRLPDGRKKTLYLHRVLTSAPQGLVVDHIDRDGLNNRLANLRVVPHKQNARNMGLSDAHTSGFKGVSWHKDQKRWRAYIRVDGRQIHLGTFDSVADARAAYREASQKYHGVFGRSE